MVQLIGARPVFFMISDKLRKFLELLMNRTTLVLCFQGSSSQENGHAFLIPGGVQIFEDSSKEV